VAPVEFAGFLAEKTWRTWAHGPRDVMHEPVWKLFHCALVLLAVVGLGLLAWRRRWEALVLATIFLAITALSAFPLAVLAAPTVALIGPARSPVPGQHVRASTRHVGPGSGSHAGQTAEDE